LLLLLIPVALAEPFKIVALFVAGKGHWFSGTAIICLAYAISLFVVERLFRIVKPKLLMMTWFATIWDFVTRLRRAVITAIIPSPKPGAPEL
jgi:hypothetical protein